MWGITATVVSTVVAIGAGVYQMHEQSVAQDKAQAAQEAARRQADANALKQQEEAMLQQNFLNQQTKAVKPANFEPGGVAVGNNQSRGGGTFS